MRLARSAPEGARRASLTGSGRRARRAATPALALAALVFSGSASAYPTAIVFSPSGESLPAGNIGSSVFSSMGILPPNVAFGGALGGFTIGLLPSIDVIRTPGGSIGFGGAEIGLDVGASSGGSSVLYFNGKLQIFRETKYWPATSIGFFQLSPQNEHNTALGYFMASKGFSVGQTYLGQLSFGMMRSFADDLHVAPRCLDSYSKYCLFRGSSPWLDHNGALLAGYFSPWMGPIGFGIDYVGGTSDVSSANVALFWKLWSDDVGGLGLIGLGGFVGLDRRASPPGPGAFDGMFLMFYVSASLPKAFGFDSATDWGKRPVQVLDRLTRSGRDDSQSTEDLPPPPKPKPVIRKIIIEDDDTPLPEPPKPLPPVKQEPSKKEPPKKPAPKKPPPKKPAPKKPPVVRPIIVE